MKKEVRLMLDYQCYPIWIYDENGIEYYIHDEMYDSFIKYTLDNNVIDDGIIICVKLTNDEI